MSDVLYSVASAVFSIGIIALLVLLYVYSPEEVKLSEVSDLPVNSYFSTVGTLTAVRETETVATLTLSSLCSVSGVYFKDNPSNISDAVGSVIKVSGHVSAPNSTIIDNIQ